MTDKHTDRVQEQMLDACAIQSVQVSCKPAENYLGEKSYRTVFNLQEAETLFVDIELLNKQSEESDRKVPIHILLYWFDGEKGVCIARVS